MSEVIKAKTGPPKKSDPIEANDESMMDEAIIATAKALIPSQMKKASDLIELINRALDARRKILGITAGPDLIAVRIIDGIIAQCLTTLAV